MSCELSTGGVQYLQWVSPVYSAQISSKLSRRGGILAFSQNNLILKNRVKCFFRNYYVI